MSDDLHALADKTAIIEVMTRYCFGVDFREWDLLDTVFADECEAVYVLEPLGLGLDDVPLSGRVAIKEWLQSVLGATGDPAPNHAMTNHFIELDGDTAKSRSYLAGGRGLYTAEHVRTADGWRANKWEMRNFPPMAQLRPPD